MAINFQIFSKPENYTPNSVVSFMKDTINLILYFSAVIAGIMIVWGGLKIITSGGNEEQVSSGKNIVKWALIGLVVIALSYTIVGYTLAVFQLKNPPDLTPSTTL